MPIDPSRRLAFVATQLARTSLLVLVLGWCGCSKDEKSPSPSAPAAQASEAEKLAGAMQLLNQGQRDEAMKLVQDVLIASPKNIEAMSIAIELHSQNNDFCEAATLAEKVAELQPDNASYILMKAFDWQLRCGNHARAEENLNKAIQLQPNAAQLHRTMSQLLNAQGRRFEAASHMRMLLRLDAISPDELLGLVDLSGPFSLVSFAEVVDDSQLTLFALKDARYEYFDQLKPEEALEILDKLSAKFPDVPAVAALQGRILSDTGDLERLTRWAKQLPAGIERHPEYWYAIGNWMAQSDRHEEAIRAFGEAIKRDPTDRQSLRLMISALDRLNQSKIALSLRPRLATLDDIFRNALKADAKQAKVIADQLQELTRPWEASGWLKLSAAKEGRLRQSAVQLAQRRQAIQAWEQSADPEKILDVRLKSLLGFDIETWPLPKINTIIAASPSRSTHESADTKMRLADIATKVGIETTFESELPPSGEPYYLYQVNGGGLAAFDYDLDGRCDIYVVHSGGKPIEGPPSRANQLYRQLPDGTYRDLEDMPLAGDRGYGQGVCAGDINQDGFLDLLIANIGSNAIYLNQGDGTFRRASELLLDNPNDWTSSIAIGDLDGDHLPDVVAANYLDDDGIYSAICQGGQFDGGRMDCVPHRFQSAVDRMYRSRGDGKLERWREVSEIDERPNYGFGILIANIDRKNGNDVFITNDGDLNHYWASQESDQNGRYTMIESAGVLGCSIGANGRSQACMGLAHGDFDRNGWIDFHVTNFYNQASNLYLQNKSGFFVDEAMKYGLGEPTYKILGFGTHGLDVDNDGWQELAILNGHVHDDRSSGIPFQMKSQLLRGGPRGFTLQAPEQVGDYWTREQLGRTMATLDWNRDGRVDLLANALDTPVALLENQSEVGDWIQLELVGVVSEREAIGAEVTFSIGDQTWTRWQTGGDGYMCSNEPIIHVGLGEADQVEQIQIRWPTGETQQWQGLKTNRRYLVTEGEPSAYERN